jgi:four helix bundle protein
MNENSMEYKKSYKKWSNKGKTLNPESLTVNQGRPEPKRKRGKLASLMSEDAKTTASIHELSYDFACRITRLFQYLTEDAEYKEYVQSKQLYRSGTSIGANAREGKHAQSEADFLSKMSIAYKEADESEYWLNLLHDNGYLDDTQFDSLKKDIDRLLKILSSIVKSMKEKIAKSKGK